MNDTIPAGFKPIEHLGHYLTLLGPFYWKKTDDKLVVGLRIGERRILRASGVFALMPPAKPKEESEG